MAKIRILIADDHPLVRSGLTNLLQPFSEFSVVGEAEDGQEAFEQAQKLRPDVVILDLSMPRMTGIEATKKIIEHVPGVRVLVLTMHENEEYVYQIFKSGASGYVLKNCPKEELAKAIYAVSSGEKYFSSRVSEIMVRGYVEKRESRDRVAPLKTEAGELLTNREREILSLIAEGMTNHQIAEKLFISTRTVETHKSNIMQKLEIADSAKLTRYAVEQRVRGGDRNS